MNAVLVTGTDTNVGKTLISAWLCLHTGAAYWKPVQAGVIERDSTTVAALAGATIVPEGYCLQQAASPHQAAAAEYIDIHLNTLTLPTMTQGLIVEGAGGVLVPLNAQHLMIDLIAQWQTPVLLVARSGLGTLNHTLLTLQALRARNINVLGVIMNGTPHAENRRAIEHYGQVSVLAEFTPLPENLDGALMRKALHERHLPEALHRALFHRLNHDAL